MHNKKTTWISLKPFLYAVSFKRGFTPSSILPDVPRNYSNDFSGHVRTRVALAFSLNVPAVYVLSKIGIPVFYKKLLSCGFESLEKGDKFCGLGLALGSGGVTLLELVRGYSAFARKGILIREKKTSLISSIVDLLKVCFHPSIAREESEWSFKTKWTLKNSGKKRFLYFHPIDGSMFQIFLKRDGQ